MAVTVSTGAYEGPIDLLLQLVTSHQVELYDVPLAQVVDDYLAVLATADVVELAELSEFLVVASVLVELKSRRLLPGPDDVEPDEELVGWEERDLLLARLLECQAYAAAGDAFATLFERAARSVPRTAGLDESVEVHAPDLLEGVTLEQLAAAYRRATAARPVPVVDLSHVTVDAVSVAEAVAELEVRLPRHGWATFRELTGHLQTRMEVIVRFLAVLELYKRGRVGLEQGRTFGELEVTWVAGDRSAGEAGEGGMVASVQVPDEYEG